jgi:hypothetical protein
VKVGKKKERKKMGHPGLGWGWATSSWAGRANKKLPSCPVEFKAPPRRHPSGGGRRRPWLRFLRGEVFFLPGRLFFEPSSFSESSLAPPVLLLLTKKQRNNTIRTGKQASFRSKSKRKKKIMASMEGLIGLMNRIQRACTALGDHGGGDLPTLWESLPTIAVVGGQVLLFPHFPDHLLLSTACMLRY